MLVWSDDRLKPAGTHPFLPLRSSSVSSEAMAAPEFVPLDPTDAPRAYSSPPRRPESWEADRPGEVVVGARQPRGDMLGNPGPDQGYVLRLVRQFEGKLHLADGEARDDAFAGCIAVALKRASLFGRAPVIHDLKIAFTLWGFLDEAAPTELVERRRTMFAEVRNAHHYAEQRSIADAVPESTLRMAPDAVTEKYRSDWASLLQP